MDFQGLVKKFDSTDKVISGAKGLWGDAKQAAQSVTTPKEGPQSKPAAPTASPAAQKTLEGAAQGETCDVSRTDLTAAKMDAKRAEGSANVAARKAQTCSEASAGCSMGQKVGKGIAAIPTPVTKVIGEVINYGCMAGKMVADCKGNQEKQKAADKGKEAQDAYARYNQLASACGEDQETADLENPNEQGALSKTNSAVNSVMGMFTQGTQAVQGLQGLFGKGEQAGGEAAAGQGAEAAAAGAGGKSGGFMGMLGGLFGSGSGGAASGAAGSAAGDAAGSAAGGMAGDVAGSVASAAV